MPSSQPAKSKRTVVLSAVLAALALYLVLFYAVPLVSLKHDDGTPWRRVEFFQFLLVPEALLEGWFGNPPELALADRIPVLAIAAAVLLWAAALGWLLMRLLGADRELRAGGGITSGFAVGWTSRSVPKKPSVGTDLEVHPTEVILRPVLTRLEVLVFSAAVGLNAVSTYVLAVGLVGLVRYRLVFVVPAVLTFAAVVWVRWKGGRESFFMSAEKSSHLGNRSSPTWKTTPGPFPLSAHWLWLAAPFVLVIVLGAMLPPLEFDVREYHLEVPKEFYQDGRIGFLPHNVYGNMPMGTEMLSLLSMSLAGDWWLGALAGKTVTAAMTLLTAAGLVAAGRRFFSPAAGVVAAVVYLSIPWIVQVSTTGLVEGASACYLFLAVYAVLLGTGRNRLKPGLQQLAGSRKPEVILRPVHNPYLLLAGYLAGGAVSCKYPAVVFVLLPLAVWIVLARWPADRWAVWKPLGVFLLCAAIGCGLWFGKNWALTGNPTYPLMYSVFSREKVSGTFCRNGPSGASHKRSLTPFPGPGWNAEKNARWQRVHSPPNFSPVALVQDLGRVGLTSEWLSPLVIPLAALAFLGPRRRPTLVLAAYVGWVLVAWWLFTHRIDRFWVPVLPVLALLAGAGALWDPGVLWRRVLLGLLVFAALANFLVASSGPGGYNRYFRSLAGLRVAEERVKASHRYLNRYARDGRVLMVGDAEVVDLEMPVYYSTCFDDCLLEQLVKGHTPDEIRAGLASRGITHVVVDWGEIARYRSPGNYGFTDFVQPAVLEGLVKQGILEPISELGIDPGTRMWFGFRVVGP